ncbi:hypothetical protein FB458_0745 [Lapillicoccus jejuensis]|uniref:Uncharacterized protein n=2 Tax=Lapillicoccus jejuensis TaxID=402171 RepID=A0A542DX61_9MICO|nr:hypothetical protein FB458_0745 [Lapillicoccus jejuensis]
MHAVGAGARLRGPGLWTTSGRYPLWTGHPNPNRTQETPRPKRHRDGQMWGFLCLVDEGEELMSGWVWRGPRAWLPWGRLLLLAAVVNLGVLALVVALTTRLGFAPAAPGASGGDPPGFLWGFWHGLLLPIAFVVSLFRPSVGLDASVHDGHAYDTGFLLGAFVILHWPFARVTRTVHHHHHHHDWTQETPRPP